MSQSLSKMFIHIIFHIKSTSVEIRKEDASELYAYIGAVLKDLNCIPILTNGVGDHIHILCVMSKTITLAKLVEDVKRHSSRWIKTKSAYYTKFAWQGGYAGFSVSPSLCEKTRKYIENQEEHHKKMTFKEEYLLFLKEYGIEYDENYLWTD
ncbi:transposase [Petrimonas sp.]|uniref:transposase n=1 Tax=Petrimonas sp. TaxID=2023866 RepID=UPI003F5197C9